MSSTVLGSEDLVVNETNRPCSHVAYNLGSYCNAFATSASAPRIDA